MIIQVLKCDQCKQPIDQTKGFITLEFFRGGATLKVNNGTNDAGVTIVNNQHYCNDTCVTDLIGGVRKSIKPLPTPKTPAPAPAQATPPASNPATPVK